MSIARTLSPTTKLDVRHAPIRRPAPRDALRRACALFNCSSAILDEEYSEQKPSSRLLAWAGSAIAMLLAIAFVIHLVWSTLLAPIDAAAGVMGQMAAVVAPADVEDSRSSTAAALQDAQSKLLRDQQSGKGPGGDLARENADRMEAARSLDAFKIAREKP